MVLSSYNQGLTWTSFTFSQTKLKDVATYVSAAAAAAAPSRSFVVAVSNAGRVVVSSDGGGSWAITPVAAALFGVTIAGNGDAFAVGAGAILKSSVASSSFSSWTFITPANVPSTTLNGVCSKDGLNVFSVGMVGVIFVSPDAGATWSVRPSGSTADLYGVSCIGASTAFVGGTGATILKTTNGGLTWASLSPNVLGVGGITSTTSFKYRAIVAVSASVVFATGSNGVVIR